MDIERWLRGLGLGQYEVAFRENAIDETVLPGLTVEDLKDLGVNIVGHRRKLLDAISALKADANAKTAAPSLISPIFPSPKDSAERRQVTVVFSDLVGWTALAARMDPEDLHEVISAYQKCVAEIAQRFNGFVAQYLGDGALVYFGYPEAHEDDAELAVRAALELVANVIGLKTRVSLQTRVGIATGPVVVGHLIASGDSHERGIVGETPNLAARLQGIAKPSVVVVAESTRRLLGNLFRFEDLGLQELKGIPKPVAAWAALEPSSVASRFEALRAADLTAFVGRDEEIELLVRRWSRAKTGEGQVVLLSGEAGIGKSRLSAALLERVASEPHVRLRYFCSPQHSDRAFYPIIGQMERAAGLAHDDTPQARLDKFDALLARTSTSKQEARLLAEMLSLPDDGRNPALDLAPERRRQKTLEALVSQMEALARQNPLLMIFEDAHWADPTSLEVLGRIVGRIATLPAVLIVTFRPEFVPPWIGQPHVTALTINRFAQREANSLIDRVIGHNPLPANIRHDIIERTDGIPLFVEEMTKAVLEARSESDAQRTVAAVPSSASTVPASLYASLMARLDRLGAAKEVAQIGAAIGREFSYALLSAVARWPEGEMETALDRLVHAGLLFRQGALPHVTYLFKHALVQDAAYGMLLRDPRRALHDRIAETLTSQFAEISESQPELLARHYTEAGLIEKAAGLWGQAGQRSLECSALVEAAEQLRRALAQIELLPTTPALRREQIKLQVALIAPLIHVSGHVAPETKAAKERARQLIEQAEALGEPLEDPLLLFSVLFGFWAASFVAFDGKLVCELARQFLALAENQKATTPLIIGHRVMSSSLLFAGEIAESLPHVEQALALYDAAKHRPLATRFGVDPRAAVVSFRSWALWLLGYPEAALNDAWRALRDAREITQAATLMFALNISSMTHVLRGSYTTAFTQLAEVIMLADEKSTLFWKALGMGIQGSALALSGNSSMAVEAMTSAISGWRSTGATLLMPLFLLHLARAYAELGQMDDALRFIGEAMTEVETTNERWCEAEVSRMAGEIALKSDQPDAARAERHFQRALAVAHEQQARSWELRAATSMARLWREQGKFQEAHDLLAPVFGWFTEGFDTHDLKEAKVLLDLCGPSGVLDGG
jgi:class 3 adenylate cyclase/predicted ATPase